MTASITLGETQQRASDALAVHDLLLLCLQLQPCRRGAGSRSAYHPAFASTTSPSNLRTSEEKMNTAR